MLFNFIVNLFLNIFLFAIGRLNYFRADAKDSNPFVSAYLGLTIIGMFSMLTSLFLPVGQWSFVFYLLVAWAIILIQFKKIYFKFKLNFLISWLFSLLVISWLIGYEVYPFNTDTDYYHANAVKWLSEYGTVLGLANLNQRLGGNSSWHVIASVFDSFILKDRTTWIMPLLSYSLAFGFFIWEYFNKDKFWQKTFSIIAICWTTVNAITWGFLSLHYDFTPLLINLIITYFYLCFLLEDEELKLFEMIFLGTSSFMMKPMGAMTIIFLMLLSILHFKNRPNFIKKLIWLWSIPALCLAIWMIRNIMLSGWPLFPTPKFALDFAWTTPFEITKKTYADVWTWARVPIEGHEKVFNWPFKKWFVEWGKINLHSLRFWLLAIIPFVLSLFIWSKLFFKKKIRYFLFSWVLASLIFWFLMAPDIRFGDGFFIAFLLAPLSCLLAQFKFNDDYKIMRFIPSLIVFSLLISIIYLNHNGKRGPLNLLTIGKHESGPIQLVNIIENDKVVLKVWKPIELDQCLKNNSNYICPSNLNLYKELSDCSNSPLPCTSYFSEKLRLIDGENLKSGFKLLQ